MSLMKNLLKNLLKRVGKFLAISVLAAAATAGSARAQASNVYVTSNGAAVGNCPAGTASAPNLTPAQFNNPSNWGTSAGQIGLGSGYATRVLMCGTINFPALTVGLVPQGSGSSSYPIVFLFDTNAILESPAFSGGPYDFCSASMSCGGISVNLVNYFIVDGGTNGIIKNTSNGTAGSYHVGSSGVFMIGTGNKLRNMTIQHIYDNVDTTAPYDDNGGDSADFIVGGTNTSVCNNEFDDARIGVSMAPADSGVGGIGTQATCQANTVLTGFNLYLNTTNEHVWDFLVNGSGNLYLYANYITGSHANWVNPHDSSPPYNNNYHQDGFISFGVDSTGNTVNTVYVFNNTCDAYVPPGANSSGCFFPTSGGPIPNHLNGTIWYAFNNLDMPNGWPTMDIGNNNEFDITSTSISGNVMTLNGFGNVDDGDTIYWSGLTGTASFLNGTNSTVASCTPCTNGKYSVSTTITISYTHANYSTASETGKGVIDVVQTYMYNNTFYGGNLNYLGTGAGITTMESNIDYFDLGGTSSAQDFYWFDDIAIANPLSSFVTFDYNMYGPITGNAYPTPDHDWFWGSGGAINSFSAWKVYCGCDSHAQYLPTPGALNLNSSFRPTDLTLFYGANLTSKCSMGGVWIYLCYDHPAVVGKGGDTIGLVRPATGSWYVGAFNPAGTGPNSPTGASSSNGGSVGAHTVVITWNPPTGSGLTYYIFRGFSSGGEGSTPINSSGVGLNCTGPSGGCSYTDSTVLAGMNLYYFVESYNGSYSVPSNETNSQVPVVAPTGLTIISTH